MPAQSRPRALGIDLIEPAAVAGKVGGDDGVPAGEQTRHDPGCEKTRGTRHED
jgi:hypothetical protein